MARHDRDGHLYDAMSYGYHTDANGRKLRNRLYNIQDLADQDGLYATDIPQMAYQPNGIVDPQDANNTINSANNFSYDVLGQRTRDDRADIALIEWTASGKMKRVHRTTASGKPDITFAYDAAGNRIMKQVGDPDVDPAGYREWYVPDAQGNIMAVYRYTNTGPKSLKVVERPIYGSKRLGSYTRKMELVGTTPPQYYPYTQPMQAPLKHYELTDHLGNVATVVTGRLLPPLGPGIQYQAEVVSATLHEPFGLELTGMNWQSNVSRFGFQNQIKDLELNSIHFKYREYFFSDGTLPSIDPLWAKYPWNSPYAFSENRVMDMVELEGLEAAPTDDKVPTPAAGSDGDGGVYSGLGDHLHAGTTRPSNFMEDDAPSAKIPSAATSLKLHPTHGESKFVSGPSVSASVPPSYALPTSTKSLDTFTSTVNNYGFGISLPTTILNTASANALSTEFKYSAPNVTAELSAFSKIRLIKCVSGVVGTTLGVAGLISHGAETYSDFNNGHYWDALAGAGKMVVDGFFIGAKVSNPAIFVGSIAYGILDYNNLLTPSHWGFNK